jgi:hypothetical protein
MRQASLIAGEINFRPRIPPVFHFGTIETFKAQPFAKKAA